MQTPLEVSHIRKRPSYLCPHKRIAGYGGIWNYKPWYVSEDLMIRSLERPVDRQPWWHWISIDGERVPLIVAVHDGRKYVTTAKDGAGTPNSLLRLPECPVDQRDWWSVVKESAEQVGEGVPKR